MLQLYFLQSIALLFLDFVSQLFVLALSLDDLALNSLHISLLSWSLFLRSHRLWASLVFCFCSASDTLNVSLAYFDFPLPYHNPELSADLNYNYDNAFRHHLSLNIHYQILLAYSIQSLMYSLMFSTPLVSGLVSHMTFSLENFLVIGSACCNSTILDTVYLEI